MSVIDVTTGQSFATVSDAITGSGSGDVIDVSAGLYSEYFPKIYHNLTIQGVGGLAQFTTPGSPTNGQGVIVIDANVTLGSLDISGAAVPDGNGAGIRLESGSLTLVASRIHNNQDGILAGAGPGSVTIRNSEIDHNGSGDGFTHNLYINEVASLTISDSYIHDAVAGHEVKSRADVTTITNTRIQDQQGNTSYSVDLPDGGAATLTGNTFQKGANTQNWTFVHFGGELFPSYANSSLDISGNTFINDLPAGASPVVLTNASVDASGNAIPAAVTGNTIYGFTGTTLVHDIGSPPDTLSANVLLPLSAAPALDTAAPFDVPEPGSLALLGGLLALAVMLNRRAARAGSFKAG